MMKNVDHEWTRSDGLLIAPFGDGYAVHDRIEHRVSQITEAAGHVLLAPTATIDAISTEFVERFSLTSDESGQLPATIECIVADLRTAGLIDRKLSWVPPEPLAVGDPEGPDLDATLGPRVSMVGRIIVFRSADRGLLEAIASSLHLPTNQPYDETPPDAVIDVTPNESGGVDVHAAEEWNFPDHRGFHIQLSGLLNDLAPRLTADVVLHAGGVRIPDGRVIVIPGRSEAGKSTLTAALVAAGCDHLGDELMGIEPDTLRVLGSPRSPAIDDDSRAVLGLPPSPDGNPATPIAALRADARALSAAGPLTDVVLPCLHLDRSSIHPEPLTPLEALEALVPAVMNLDRITDDGWRALCQAVERCRVRRLHHPDANESARFLMA